MKTQLLLEQLGTALGITLQPGEAGTCRLHFDQDEVDFEQTADGLYIMADVGSAEGRQDAWGRLLRANCLGAESGGACLSLDDKRGMFMLHTVIDTDASYPNFEKALTRFVRALRYWKEWLALGPAADKAAAPQEALPPDVYMLRV